MHLYKILHTISLITTNRLEIFYSSIFNLNKNKIGTVGTHRHYFTFNFKLLQVSVLIIISTLIEVFVLILL